MTGPRDTTTVHTGVPGLVLPGGGARGAYQAGALKAIAEILATETNPFPVIMGASVGAINAVALAAKAQAFSAGVGQLVEFWRSLHPDSIYRTDLATILTTGAQWVAALTPLGTLGVVHPRSILDSTPLRELVHDRIDFGAIARAIDAGALRAVGVTASSYDRARAITFFQGHRDILGWQRARRDGVPVSLIADHVLASSALPVLFEAVRIGKEYYGDGSLRLTAPLSPAIHCGADRILVIGARDATPPAEVPARPGYPGLGTISGYLLDMVFMDNLDADIERTRRIDRTLNLLPPGEHDKTGLRHVEVLMLQPSIDIRSIARTHQSQMPRTVRMLLRRLGIWGNDWRMPSFLLFTPDYCGALIDLGFRDTMARRAEICRFLRLPDGSRAAI